MKASVMIKILELYPDAEILIRHYSDIKAVGSIEMEVKDEKITFIMKETA